MSSGAALDKTGVGTSIPKQKDLGKWWGRDGWIP